MADVICLIGLVVWLLVDGGVEMLLLLLTHLPHNLIMMSLLINKLFLCQVICNTGPRWKL